ncbi:MAG TPA: hypothetical protein VGO11_02345 [Chthoniobacteraceae bacterium]|nr:hypothetical protein [Chthoniobacteraceae bacterium]
MLPNGPMRLLAVLALCLMTGAAGAEPTEAAQRFAYCLGLAREEGATLADEQALFAGELRAGAARGAWSADEEAAGAAFLGKTFDEFLQNPVASRSLPLFYYAKARSGFFPPSITSTAPLLASLARLDALDSYYAEVRSALRLSALAYVDEVWRHARTNAELIPAQEALQEAKFLVSMWDDLGGRRMASRGESAPFYYGATKRAPYLGIEESLELIDCWSIVAAPKPLLLPRDPATDPEAYLQFHGLWRTLEGMGNKFTRRPAIRRAVAEADEQFRHACEFAAEEVRAALLRGASPAELSGPVQRLRRFCDEVNLPSLPYDSLPYSPGFGSAKPLDYRNFIAGRVPRTTRNDLISNALLEECRRSINWLSLLQAEERGDRRAVALGQEWLRQSLAGVKGPHDELMRRHLPPESPSAGASEPVTAAQEGARPAMTTTGEPTAALLASLRALRRPGSEGVPNLEPLIAVWQAVQKGGGAAAGDRAGPTAGIWMSLASTPEGATLLQLRDRAAWAALGRPSQPARGDLATEWMAQFEAALVRGAWEEAGRLLVLDGACGILDSETRFACLRTLPMMRNAAELTVRGDRAQARESYLQIIRERLPLNIGAMAAGKLKALPAAK